MKINVLVVANNSEWKTWSEKFDELRRWFAPKVDLSFRRIDTAIKDIPFVPYTSVDPEQNKIPNLKGIDPDFYNKNFLPLAYTNDQIFDEILLVVLNRKDWQEPNRARGWRTDSESGIVELHIGCDENNRERWGGYPGKTDSFFQLARHEILHALYMISGQPDTVHFWWDRGQLNKCLDELYLDPYQLIPFWKRGLNYAIQLFAKAKPPMTTQDKIFEKAYSLIGTDASPRDLADDEIACAESVTTIIRSVVPEFPIVTGTALLQAKLKSFSNWVQIPEDEAHAGCIIISPTGEGNGKLKHGHVGIVSKNRKVMSNHSPATGRGQWLENFTIESWENYYKGRGGFPVRFYKRKV